MNTIWTQFTNASEYWKGRAIERELLPVIQEFETKRPKRVRARSSTIYRGGSPRGLRSEPIKKAIERARKLKIGGRIQLPVPAGLTPLGWWSSVHCAIARLRERGELSGVRVEKKSSKTFLVGE